MLTHGDVRAAICRWQAAGLSVATVSARWLVLRSAMSWAVAEGVLRTNPLAGMRGPPRPEPRKHHSQAELSPSRTNPADVRGGEGCSVTLVQAELDGRPRKAEAASALPTAARRW